MEGPVKASKQALLFLKKKKQKDFLNLGHWRWPSQNQMPSIMKVFAEGFNEAIAWLFLILYRFHQILLR
jgi:hypothetical protein